MRSNLMDLMDRADLTDLTDQFFYNTSTGVFFNKNSQEIGSKGKKSRYFIISIKGKLYYAQTLAYLYVIGRFPRYFLTFKDRNPFNLKWDNIEEASRVTITRRITLRSSNTSGVTGITFCKQTGKWKASVFVNGKNRYQGRYDIFDEAVLARYLAELKFGFLKDNPNTSAAQYVRSNQTPAIPAIPAILNTI